MKAAIVDYRMGNLASVAKALEKVGADPFVSDKTIDLGAADLLVLPGVGNFASGKSNLDSLQLCDFIVDWAGQDRPILGICLGLQLLFESSEEGSSKGLGILRGDVKRLNSGVKIPHMGWNTISSSSSSKAFGPFDGHSFYFVHSYACVPEQASSVVTTSYGSDFVSAIESGRICGTQFHPEKSSSEGLALLAHLLEVIV